MASSARTSSRRGPPHRRGPGPAAVGTPAWTRRVGRRPPLPTLTIVASLYNAPNNSLVQVQDRLGRRTSFTSTTTANQLAQLAAIITPLGTRFTHLYDGNSRVCSYHRFYWWC